MRTNAIDRRDLLTGLSALSGLVFLSGSARARVRVLASAAEPAARGGTLVLVQLAGGNDGLSTVVPFGDDGYQRARNAARVGAREVLALDDYRGLHPGLRGLRALFDKGRLAIVEGAGYPSPNRSHFKSFEIWHAADPRGRAAGDGWIGRLNAQLGDPDPNRVVHVGDRPPYSLASATHPAASFAAPAGYRWFTNGAELGRVADGPEPPGVPGPELGARAATLESVWRLLGDARASSRVVREAAARYRPRAEYPRDDFAEALMVAAALIEGDVGARVVSVELGGFDTHNDQRGRHDALMQRLDEALVAFAEDLRASAAGRGTLVLAFSEFGRRVAENGSRGTDHGTAGPMFLLGDAVRGGLYGRHPGLDELDEGDLIHTTDFRSVYATVIEKGFGVPHERVLGARWPMLPVLPT